ncbi:MAG TPA: pilus assembly protein [Terricaulis sp.]|nr:pilus assembly protein [Terricaulis sp.]
MVRLFQWRSSIRRFAKAKRGAVAIEFGLIAVPFFLLFVGTAEVGLMGLGQNSLDNATSIVGRDIRTGRAQANGVTQAEIFEALCAEVNDTMPMACNGRLYLDVRRYPSFVAAAAGTAAPIDGDGMFQPADFRFEPGLDSEIVVVRAFYRWEAVTPLLGRVLANTNGGERILVSTMMFRNEPFGAVS